MQPCSITRKSGSGHQLLLRFTLADSSPIWCFSLIFELMSTKGSFPLYCAILVYNKVHYWVWPALGLLPLRNIVAGQWSTTFCRGPGAGCLSTTHCWRTDHWKSNRGDAKGRGQCTCFNLKYRLLIFDENILNIALDHVIYFVGNAGHSILFGCSRLHRYLQPNGRWKGAQLDMKIMEFSFHKEWKPFVLDTAWIFF